jgi:hypothetical protein
LTTQPFLKTVLQVDIDEENIWNSDHRLIFAEVESNHHLAHTTEIPEDNEERIEVDHSNE